MAKIDLTSKDLERIAHISMSRWRDGDAAQLNIAIEHEMMVMIIVTFVEYANTKGLEIQLGLPKKKFHEPEEQ